MILSCVNLARHLVCPPRLTRISPRINAEDPAKDANPERASRAEGSLPLVFNGFRTLFRSLRSLHQECFTTPSPSMGSALFL